MINLNQVIFLKKRDIHFLRHLYNKRASSFKLNARSLLLIANFYFLKMLINKTLFFITIHLLNQGVIFLKKMLKSIQEWIDLSIFTRFLKVQTLQSESILFYSI
ncbi:MAG: hypothetical protein RL329_2996 [Bacteroidota bacterium]|jgi:hypothetical protein